MSRSEVDTPPSSPSYLYRSIDFLPAVFQLFPVSVEGVAWVRG